MAGEGKAWQSGDEQRRDFEAMPTHLLVALLVVLEDQRRHESRYPLTRALLLQVVEIGCAVLDGRDPAEFIAEYDRLQPLALSDGTPPTQERLIDIAAASLVAEVEESLAVEGGL